MLLHLLHPAQDLHQLAEAQALLRSFEPMPPVVDRGHGTTSFVGTSMIGATATGCAPPGDAPSPEWQHVEGRWQRKAAVVPDPASALVVYRSAMQLIGLRYPTFC